MSWVISIGFLWYRAYCNTSLSEIIWIRSCRTYIYTHSCEILCISIDSSIAILNTDFCLYLPKIIRSCWTYINTITSWVIWKLITCTNRHAYSIGLVSKSLISNSWVRTILYTSSCWIIGIIIGSWCPWT